MRIAIRVRNGQAAGRRIVLRGGQIARFGRTDWSDFAFPSDELMAEVHFAIQCTADVCTLKALSHDHETLVNGQAVDAVRLQAGDLITAGQIQFLVELEPGSPTEDAVAPVNAATEVTAPVQEDVRQLAAYFGLSAEALELAAKCTENRLFASQLSQAELLADAVRWQAHYQAKPQAVAWGCQCIEADVNALSDPLQTAAWQAALAWVHQPTEEHRLESLRLAEAANMDGIGGVMAAAAGWSGGSLAPSDLPEVPPDERLTGRCIFIALKLAIGLGAPADSENRLRQFLGSTTKPIAFKR